MIESLITVSSLATLALEGLKNLVRLIKKDWEFDFSPAFYGITIPVMQLLVQPALVWMDVLPADQLTLSFKLLITVFIQSLMSVVIYNTGVKPFKTYREEQAIVNGE